MKVIPLFKNESQLIARAAKNHRGSQERLYAKYSPKMLSVCRMYIKDLHHAEEVMLNGFFKVFANLSSFKNEGSFEGWVRKIMIRESISFLRSERFLNFQENGLENYSESTNNIQSGMEVEEIQSLIDALPEGYRVVFVMYAVEGYKHHEIATLLGITEGTSKSQLFKARKMLQEKLSITENTSYGTT
ncbi:RNA polymerase sigma factor [Antarcticibacterium flavum]|uniref:RNA polymerase sigma factor n=1 Tax=Antarcticibacterium flavum TaxID=2058175 RepID=A0A5B7X049_9FLAO|nr:RNA polymerase sigma factor [Antarcticibacterium flavum]MCM4159865.1 RNA polymerase subunit sigma-70 [Antarcticibacterium sp. W02-3]QCY68866.1 RNA polymerase sigma factor [Antarcticibacterium flavum]